MSNNCKCAESSGVVLAVGGASTSAHEGVEIKNKSVLEALSPAHSSHATKSRGEVTPSGFLFVSSANLKWSQLVCCFFACMEPPSAPVKL